VLSGAAALTDASVGAGGMVNAVVSTGSVGNGAVGDSVTLGIAEAAGREFKMELNDGGIVKFGGRTTADSEFDGANAF
jgi:hypothetical protein